MEGKSRDTWKGKRRTIFSQISHRSRWRYTPEEIAAAAQNHEQGRIEQAARHSGATGKSKYLPPLVYGSLDGIVTTFAVVSGVIGANLSPGIILVLGFANLFGDGFSMAMGAYLSAKSEQEVFARERQKTAQQVAQAPDQEKESLSRVYRGQGYSEQDAQVVTEIVSGEPGRLVSAVMVERHLMVPQKIEPALQGVATLIAFVLIGAVPLLAYLADFMFELKLSPMSAFMITVILTGLALLGAGAAKVLVTDRSAVRSAIETLLVGGFAGLVAFGVGVLLKGLGAPSP